MLIGLGMRCLLSAALELLANITVIKMRMQVWYASQVSELNLLIFKFHNTTIILYTLPFIEPPAPEVTNFTLTDTSVFVTWQPRTLPAPETYLIALQSNTSSSKLNVTYTVNVEVPGTATEIQFQHFPVVNKQKYQYCLTAVYAQQASDCVCNFITSQARNTSQMETETVCACSCQYALVGGVLGSIIVLLILLYILSWQLLLRALRPRFWHCTCYHYILRHITLHDFLLTKTSNYFYISHPLLLLKITFIRRSLFVASYLIQVFYQRVS